MRTPSTPTPDDSDAFEDDFPTVLPSPVHERSLEDMEEAYSGGTPSTSATPTLRKTSEKLAKNASHADEKDAEKQASISPVTSQNMLDKGKGPASARTESTAAYDGEGTEESPYIVDWAEDDPENPMRWVRTIVLRSIMCRSPFP